MSERWLPVLGYEGLYEVSDQGRVRSLSRWIVYANGRGRNQPGQMIALTRSDGAVTVSLSREGHTRGRIRVHKLVLEAFVGPCPPGLECCHGDDDHTNNRLENLRWDTSSANKYDGVRNGRHHNAIKTHCKRGHLLAPPNLRPGALHRECRACNAAHVAHWQNPSVDIQTYADEFYARLNIAV